MRSNTLSLVILAAQLVLLVASVASYQAISTNRQALESLVNQQRLTDRYVYDVDAELDALIRRVDGQTLFLNGRDVDGAMMWSPTRYQPKVMEIINPHPRAPEGWKRP